ncbi:hypothetical protein SAMN05428957_105113 [Oryzisolibacter propanilivorax]|uniref:YqjK-like protein n=1 Tax=Oryzisolibacter propanilivorax TaxID=1527607 RepID=A0A1G9SSA3_9BURK|nr:hypothetical protein [Oryzisolibacter propanilivorax]SDM38293.1 hypothetical protein SAMN05428957_105113 [Oryzisolibacter propanilivorax]
MSTKPLPTPSPEQQQVLDRILVQRERLRARREAYRQTRAIVQARAGIDPDAALPAKLLAFARLHPVAVAAVAGVAMMAGPGRLFRLARVLLPLAARLRR